MKPTLIRVAVALVAAGALVGLVWTLAGTPRTTPKTVDLPGAVSRVTPQPGELDLRQVEVSAFLAPGFVPDSLGVDGRDAPVNTRDITYTQALNLVQFATDSELRPNGPGRHCATVTYHAIERPGDTPTPFRWCFTFH